MLNVEKEYAATRRSDDSIGYLLETSTLHSVNVQDAYLSRQNMQETFLVHIDDMSVFA